MLNRHVLILNQNYEPMTVCTARRAIVLVYLGKAELIEKYDFLCPVGHTTASGTQHCTVKPVR